MTSCMIATSSSIVYSYIGIAWWKVDLFPETIGFGQMVIVVSSRATFLGFSLLGILRSLVVVIVRGRFLGRAVERDLMTGQGLS
jgi:hypothetical protein